LLLAQRLLRDNYATGMFRLGVSQDVAETIVELSPAQMVSLASSSSLLCRFRLDDHGCCPRLPKMCWAGCCSRPIPPFFSRSSLLNS